MYRSRMRCGAIAPFAALIALVTASPVLAGLSQSYDVLNRDGSIALTPAPPGGNARLIPNSFGGTGFAIDSSGNFIVATAGSLMKVTPGGVSSLIFSAPAGSQFIDVAIDKNGNYVVADNELHRIVRISSSGATLTPVASYSVATADELEDVSVRIDSAGNYIVADDNSSTLSVFRVTPSGSVTQLSLSGVPSGSFEVGGMTFDAAGNYVITSSRGQSILDIRPSGAVSTLAAGSLLSGQITGIARDPATGNFIVANRMTDMLLTVTPGGTVTTGFSDASLLKAPVDVAITGASAPPPTSVPLPAALLVFPGAAALALWGRRRLSVARAARP